VSPPGDVGRTARAASSQVAAAKLTPRHIAYVNARAATTLRPARRWGAICGHRIPEVGRSGQGLSRRTVDIKLMARRDVGDSLLAADGSNATKVPRCWGPLEFRLACGEYGVEDGLWAAVLPRAADPSGSACKFVAHEALSWR
jgi:hypothetical protein